jgi:uncharacterized protein
MEANEAPLPVLDDRYCGFRLRAGPSPVHGWGVFAQEAIPSGRQVIEYTGEWVRQIEWRRYVDRPILYLFEYDDEWMVDGGAGGSGAEHINHSCDPNLAIRKLDRHLLLFSLRAIAVDEELSLDYRISPDTQRMICRCGSPRCRGFLNRAE